MTILGTLITSIRGIFIWGSLIISVLSVFTLLRHKKDQQPARRKLVIFIGHCIYITTFLVGRIFFLETFEMIASIFFWMILIYATQKAKYEDRKAGRRGWYQ